MDLLLDTHALIWLDAGSERLGRRVRRRIDQAQSVAMSSISILEVGLLSEQGRLKLSEPIGLWRRDLISAGIVEVDVDGAISTLAAGCSGLDGDPMDRLIAASAIHTGRTLVTADSRIATWARRAGPDILNAAR